MTTAITTTPQVYEEMLVKRQDRLSALLAGSDIKPEAFIGMTVQSLARYPALLEPDIDRESLLLAILTVAEMGLTPNGIGGAYLVPYRDRKTGKRRVQAITDWRGFIKMAMRSGQITSAKAELVYEGDQFEVELGDSPRLFHTPTLGRHGEPERGDVTHVYAVAHLPNGDRVFEVMTMAEVAAIRDRGGAPDSKSPWVTDPGEMYRKTAIRRLFKYLPVAVTPALAAALAREDDWEDEQAARHRAVVRPMTSRQQRLLAHATGTELTTTEDGGSASTSEPVSADPGTPQEAVQSDGLPALPS